MKIVELKAKIISSDNIKDTRLFMKALLVKRASEDTKEWSKEKINEVLSIISSDEFSASLLLVCKGFGDNRIAQALKTAIADKDFLVSYRDKVQYYIDSTVWVSNLVKTWIKELNKLGIESSEKENYLEETINQLLGGYKEV